MTDDPIKVSIQVSNSEEAREVEALLKEAGAAEVHTTGEGEQGILPIIIAVIGIAAGAALADAIRRWRESHMCQEIIDARDPKGDVVIKQNCDIKDGRIIVLTSDDQKVEIHEVPDGIDINKIVEAAIKSGADAVKAAADAVGAKADDPKPVGATV